MRRSRSARPDRSDADSGQLPDERAIQKAIEATAVRLLARREHSVDELRRKLQGRGHPESAVNAVLVRLQARRLVSNDRFTSSFVQHHAERGQGPVRIRAELRQQGIAEESIDAAIDAADIDWQSRIQAVRRRKFGEKLPRSLPERAKQARFLQYRGFSTEQIRAALKSDMESSGSVTDADTGLDSDPDL